MAAANPAAVESAANTKRVFPGYGLPLNYEPEEERVTLFMADAADKQIDTLIRRGFNPAYKYPQFTQQPLFPNALRSGERRLLPLRELTMMRLMNSITDKPNWVEKIFNSEITAKWKSEAMASTEDLTERMFSFCIAELQIRADTFKKHGYVVAYDGDVVKSDTAVSENVAAALRHAVKILEDVPEKHMDWHPGSDGKVLDLVHPSLFPLVYGRSRILEQGKRMDLGNCLEFAGTGVGIQESPEDQTRAPRSKRSYGWTNYHSEFRGAEYSLKYQWLPCDVVLKDRRPKITSYINNLHPVHHRPLYPVIESLIDAAIPLWNATLTTSDYYTPRVPYNGVEYEPNLYSDPGYPVRQKDESSHDYHMRVWKFKAEIEERQTLLVPEPALPMIDLNLDDKYKINLKRDYKNFQVIVKLANIILTPETPEYEGGTWHVEGQANEHICATALYYYDCQNITESHLSFRQLSSKGLADRGEGLYYQQDRHDWLLDVFGFKNEEDSLQEIGSVICSQGRLITFPNTLQHRVQPFKLADPTKPGHRKIVALFLVDPNLPIISTAIVPPQRQDWWAEKVLETGAVDGLPQELKDDVLQKVGEWPVRMEEAKTTRLDLMAERKVYVTDHTNDMKSTVFSLCEH